MLKYIHETAAEVPESYKSLYAEAGGKWVLQVDGAVPKATVDSFRDNNIALTKERDALREQFKGVDAAEYQTLRARALELDEGKLIKKEGLEAAVTARVTIMREDYEKRLGEATNRIAANTAEIGKLKIDTALIEAGTKAGLRPEAARDFVARGRDVFRLDDEGNVIAVEADGRTKRFGASGTVLSISEFVQTVAKDKDYSHLFQPSSGAGAGGGTRGAGTGVNPFKAGSFNLTQQAQLMRDNPTMAAQLKAEAGAAA